MYKAIFYIDGIEGMFEGYTDGSNWNGWATPYFTYEEGERIMDAITELHKQDDELPIRGEVGYYDEAEDAFIVPGEGDNEAEIFYGMDIKINGKKIRVYPIGNGSWIWDEY